MVKKLGYSVLKNDAHLDIDCHLCDKWLQCADAGVCDKVGVVNALL